MQPGCRDERLADNGQVEQPGGRPHLGAQCQQLRAEAELVRGQTHPGVLQPHRLKEGIHQVLVHRHDAHPPHHLPQDETEIDQVVCRVCPGGEFSL